MDFSEMLLTTDCLLNCCLLCTCKHLQLPKKSLNLQNKQKVKTIIFRHSWSSETDYHQRTCLCQGGWKDKEKEDCWWSRGKDKGEGGEEEDEWIIEVYA